FDVIALLGDVSALGNAIADDSDGDHSEDADADDYCDHDENDFEGAAAAGGRWCGNCAGCGYRSSRGCAAFVAEFCSRIKGGAAFIAKCHDLPRDSGVKSRRREYIAELEQGRRQKTLNESSACIARTQNLAKTWLLGRASEAKARR